MHDANRAAELTALLDWYREMGADEAVGEAAIDWLARGNAAPGHSFHVRSPRKHRRLVSRREPQANRPLPALLPLRLPSLGPPRWHRASSRPRAPDAAVMAARSAARHAATLDDLAATLASFDGCASKPPPKTSAFTAAHPRPVSC